MVLGLAGFGVQPLIVGDLKPDYRDLIEALAARSSTSRPAAAASTSSTTAERWPPPSGSRATSGPG
jgi:hypothetical protein